MLGILKLNSRIKNIGKFGFHFTTAIYLLTPLALLLLKGGDALLPAESALCTGLSIVNGGLAVKRAKEALT